MSRVFYGFLILATLSVSSSAYAGNKGLSDSLGLEELDPGATLTLSQSINIPNGQNDLVIGGKINQGWKEKERRQVNCTLDVSDPRGHGFDQDVVLPKNSVITLSLAQYKDYNDDRGGKQMSNTLAFTTASGDRVTMVCDKDEKAKGDYTSGGYAFYSKSISIGEFKKLFSGIAVLLPAAPMNLTLAVQTLQTIQSPPGNPSGQSTNAAVNASLAVPESQPGSGQPAQANSAESTAGQPQ